MSVERLYKRMDDLSAMMAQEKKEKRCPIKILKRVCLLLSAEVVIKHEISINEFLQDVCYIDPILAISDIWVKMTNLLEMFKNDITPDEDIMICKIVSGNESKGALVYSQEAEIATELKLENVTIISAPLKNMVEKMHAFLKKDVPLFLNSPKSPLGECYVCGEKESSLKGVYDTIDDSLSRFRFSAFNIYVYLCEKKECQTYLKILPEIALEHTQSLHLNTNLQGKFVNVKRSSGKIHKAKVNSINVIGGKIAGINLFFFADEKKNLSSECLNSDNFDMDWDTCDKSDKSVESIENIDINNKMSEIWEEWTIFAYPGYDNKNKIDVGRREEINASLLSKEVPLKSFRRDNPHFGEIIIHSYF